MIDFIQTTENESKSISSLTLVEVRAAIRRREKMGDITPADANLALRLWDVEAVRMRELFVTQAVLSLARDLVDAHALKTLDALQLASALAMHDTRLGILTTFVSADESLLLAAKKENLYVWNPIHPFVREK